ncbi:MAG: hypothetical protein KAS32_07625 [Candidatus Peribacteraceae bacterium]|nr:hypothetical protein [Candidatus Peribacteraceae bacterium]
MGDRIATVMEYWTPQLVKMKITRRKILVRYSVFGFLFFLSPIPSSKRVARCTNILHTGATLSGVGEGQRLSWGLRNISPMTITVESKIYTVQVDLPILESLNSAAEIRHSARNTRL